MCTYTGLIEAKSYSFVIYDCILDETQKVIARMFLTASNYLKYTYIVFKIRLLYVKLQALIFNLNGDMFKVLCQRPNLCWHKKDI